MEMNVKVEVDAKGAELHDVLLDNLGDLGVAPAFSTWNNVTATVTVHAETFADAVATAIDRVQAATGANALTAEVLPTTLFDERADSIDLSVTEAAAALGVSTQRVRALIRDHKIAFRRVGKGYVIPSGAVAQRRALAVA